MSNLMQFDQAAERYNAALSSFRAIYTAQVPPPERKTATTERMDTVLFWGLLATLFGAVVVSASHTIPVFLQGQNNWVAVLLAICTFVMIECGIITYAFFNVRRSDVRHEITKVKVLARRGLFGILLIALGTNVKYVFTPEDTATLGSAGLTLWNVADFAITGLVAFSAPLVAYVTGELLAIVSVYEASKQARLDEEYRVELAQWNDDMLTAWRRDQRNWGVKVRIEETVSLPVSEPLSVSVSPDRRLTDTPYGYKRQSSGLQAVIQHLTDNPSDQTMTVRELGRLTGVSPDTAARGLKAWRASQEVSNAD